MENVKAQHPHYSPVYAAMDGVRLRRLMHETDSAQERQRLSFELTHRALAGKRYPLRPVPGTFKDGVFHDAT